MAIETTRMSSRGQLVIPQDVRNDVGAGEGTVFAVAGAGDTILLKKVLLPSKEDVMRRIRTFSKESRRQLEAKGLKEADLHAAVERHRRS